MKVVKFFIRLIFFALVVSAYFGTPWREYALRPLDFLWGAVITLLLGRFFCDVICPLGIVQSVVNKICHPKAHVRRVCSRLPETKLQRVVRWSVVATCVVLAMFGMMGVATMIFPLSIFGKALTLWIPGVAMFAVVVVLSVIAQGRVWCNWICPFGTIYNLISKISPCKNKIGAGCGNCKRCFAHSVATEENKKNSNLSNRDDGLSRRATLKGVAMLAVADKLTDGGFAPVSLPGDPNRPSDILPPGAGSSRVFNLKCVGCQLCVANCPGQCLKPSVKLATFGQPIMDFRYGYCLSECTRCGEVCPTNAISLLRSEQRPNVHMGHSIWKKDRCVRTTNGDNCTACVRKCPVNAIHLVDGFPVIDKRMCIGCGACEHVCPARPLPAIFVKGFANQRIVKPIDESDLLDEMMAKLDSGASVVVAHRGVIIAVEEGRGIAPLMKLYDAGKLKDAIVVDKVIGRAAAAICVIGGAKKVVAKLGAKGAEKLLADNNISFIATTIVDQILNREKNGICPMEKSISGLNDPKQMVETLKKALR